MAAISADKKHYFIVKNPRCEWLGKDGVSLALLGNHYTFAQGEGKTIILASTARAEAFVLVGDPYSSCDILLASERSFGLELNFRKEEVGNDLSLWCVCYPHDASPYSC